MAAKQTRTVLKQPPPPERARRGHVDRSVMFPVAPPTSEAPSEYNVPRTDVHYELAAKSRDPRRTHSPEDRHWYAPKARERGWTSDILALQLSPKRS